MAAGLSAVDVLNLVLIVGFLSALFGWVGGAGALRSIRAKLAQVYDVLESFDARIKRREGSAGQAATQRRRTSAQQADDEADRLAQALSRNARAPRMVTEQDEEEAQLVALEREAEARGLKKVAKS